VLKKDDELTIGQLAERSGASTSALRYYETHKLINSARTTGNQRRYPRQMLRRIAFIRASQRVGLPLAAIRDALDALPSQRTPTHGDWARISAHWQADLNQRIAELTRLRDYLTDCIGCGCLSLKRCKLSNPEDVLGQQGPGPRKLME
jgi:MerR family redox-sensitive transcriptional activator SoxR